MGRYALLQPAFFFLSFLFAEIEAQLLDFQHIIINKFSFYRPK